MTRTKAAILAVISLLFIFVLDGLRERMPPVAYAYVLPKVVSDADAALAACALPKVGELARTWRVTSTQCTSGACASAHLVPGDQLTFSRDISGAAQFALTIATKQLPVRYSKTEGYTLAADGVAAVKGPITFTHNALDGSPLDLHYLIVRLSAQDVDGSGTCKPHATIEVCVDQPAPGATSCAANQHNGLIHVDP